MTEEKNFVQPAIPRFDGHYDHWSIIMENLLGSNGYWSLIETGYRNRGKSGVVRGATEAIGGFDGE